MLTGTRTLTIHAGCFAVCKLPPEATIPAWAVQSGWFSVTRTRGELSMIGDAQRVPTGVSCERDFRLMEVEGPLPFSAVGVLARLTAVLAEANVPVLAVSTYDTDYLLVRESQLPIAIGALKCAAYEVLEREAPKQTGETLNQEGKVLDRDTAR